MLNTFDTTKDKKNYDKDIIDNQENLEEIITKRKKLQQKVGEVKK